MSEVVELSQEALETIGTYVRRNLSSWMEEVRPQGLSARDLELTERMVRVEEELKTNRELMRQGFEAMEKQFEGVDKRFELEDKRIGQIDRRLDDLSSHMNRWFTVMTIILGVIGIAVTLSNVIS